MSRPPTPVPATTPATATATGARSNRPGGAWRDAFLAVLGLLLPVACVGCGRPDRAVCAACRTDLEARPRCRRLVAGVRLDAAFAYEGLVRALVLELKLRNRTDLAPALAERFGVLVRRALDDTPGALLVRVPPSRTGARRRGFDPVVLLLRRSRAVGRRRVARSRTLRRARPAGTRPVRTVGAALARTPDAAAPTALTAASGAHGQKERTALERVEATVGTLRASGVSGCDVVVVDDVVTTGVTMAEAVRAVRAAGGRVVRCVALAEVEE